jgi:hypothetical protein
MNFKRVAAIVAFGLLVGGQSSAIPVDLGTAGNFVILAKSGISTTGTTTVVGDIGVSPIGATGITGFGLVMDASNTFATSALVVGRAYAADYSPPTPANLTTAVSDMETAYTWAAGRPADVTELGAGNIGGLTIAPGVYHWGTGVDVTTDVTLSGGASDVWIFQIAGNLVASSSTEIVLIGGAQAKNVFWQVAGQTTLGSMSRFKGIILDKTAIVMNTGATLDGRALAQTAVTLQSNAVAQAVPTLAEQLVFIESSDDPADNTCGIGVIGTDFQAFGDVRGVGTNGQAVRISYDTPQPTSTRRSSTMIKVKQSRNSALNVLFDGTSATGGAMIIPKCSIKGLAQTTALTGSVSVKCQTDALLASLTANQRVSFETAVAGSPGVRLTKKSILISCRGNGFGS